MKLIIMQTHDILLCFAAMLILLIVPISSKAAQNSSLRAAAGKVDITPTRPAFIAGYENNRLSTGAHDLLMARCLVLEAGGVRVAFVSCDLIGTPRLQVVQIRARVKSVAPEHLIIAATHTHSGPDPLGMWGRDIQTSGVDQEWMASVRAKIAALVDSTSAQLQPAQIRFADTKDVPRISKNIRVPQILDKELAVMQLTALKDGKTISTFVNYACHPEIMDTHTMTADFPHWLYDTVEGGGGGVCLYFNGAQGGMITADFDESTAPKGENWKAAEQIGTAMGQRVLELAKDATVVTEDVPIHVQNRIYNVPLENPQFKYLIAVGVFPKDMVKNGSIETEVSHITIGPAEFCTIPGEALPNIGFYLKRLMSGKPKFLLGLCDDFLGYILTPEDYGLQLYAYETRVSTGSQMEPLMVQNLRSMLTSPHARADTQTGKH